MSSEARDPGTTSDFEQTVQHTTYFLWENDGRTDGREQEYWFRAVELCSRARQLEPATHDVTAVDPVAERAVEVSRKVGLQRPFKKDRDDTVSGRFSQKSPGAHQTLRSANGH